MPYEALPDSINRELVFDFFWKFAKLECVLKREGYLTTGRNGEAKPDWVKFSTTIQDRLNEVHISDFKEAIQKLITCPPRCQMVRENELIWQQLERRSDESEAAFVVRLVRTARNNLFHGGKYQDGEITEIARDNAILEASLKILEGFYELHNAYRMKL